MSSPVKEKATEIADQTRHNYETFFDSINDFLFVLDEQGNIIHTNATVINRLGFSKEELHGKSVLLVHPAERREEAGRIVGEMLNGVATFCPVPLLTKSGSQIPVETRVSHGFWDGKPAIFGVTKDISKIKLSEEKFSKLFQTNPSACGLSDLHTHRYIEVNEAFYSLFGFDKNEVIGKTALELGILSSETLTTVLKKAQTSGSTSNIEAELYAKNGEKKHVLLSSENIYVQDNQYRFTVVHDITERKSAEADIKLKNEELRRINSEKDKYFSIIAHDLRSPFQTLLGFSRMMVEELPSLTLNEIQKMAVNMRTSANKLYNLLENLLEWSQMQRGLTIFKPESFMLMDGIRAIIELVREAADTKMIRIENKIPEDMMVKADEQMFSSLMRNLVFNAIKYTPKGGHVVFDAKSLPDDWVEISVTDTGIGMSREMIGNLFGLSGEANRKGTEGEPSTGLGLIICKDFIDKHNGKIRVESEEGKGSTFYFTLPRGDRVKIN